MVGLLDRRRRQIELVTEYISQANENLFQWQETVKICEP